MSHPARGAWIETMVEYIEPERAMSHPARGAWIETALRGIRKKYPPVAPRPGCVD